MQTEFDVVVVGAGINGLAAACYLQRAGLAVAVVERRNECGPFALTEDIFGAGVPVDTHAGVCFLTMSPVWADLDLDSFGLDLVIPEIPAGTIWKDGSNLLYSYDPAKTHAAFSRHSEKDADTFSRLVAAVQSNSVEILERVVFSQPSDEGLDYIWSLGELVGFSPADFKSMNAFEMVDLLYENERVKMSLLGGAAINTFGDVAEKGEGALMQLLAMTVTLGIPRGGMHHLVHSLVRCFRHHGGTLLFNAPVEKVTFAGGRPDGVVLSADSPYPELEIRARHAVNLHVSPPLALEMLGERRLEQADPGLWRRMKDWDMTGHCAFTSYVLFDRVPEWKSASWDPDVARCAFPLRAWDSWEHAKLSFQLAKNEELFGMAADVGEMYNLGAVDPTRLGPKGQSVVVYEVEYPVNLRRYGGVKAWDDRELTDRLHEAHVEDLRAMIAGFDERRVADSYTTPVDNWRRNPSAVYGHELGGDCSGGQWYQGRMPSRADIEGLYFSQGVWPASLTHLGNGYVTACAMGEDLGVRQQDWWTNRPAERFFERLMK
ncbi:MAG: NAD(P)/FAD-dependent oxidoreductase [Proteobacteria bacterium]|nr:NAD(P)/FAD-dependent oxidoreductase [Pseudomonadota bacterium]